MQHSLKGFEYYEHGKFTFYKFISHIIDDLSKISKLISDSFSLLHQAEEDVEARGIPSPW